MLGARVDHPARLLGDNKSVILNTSVPSSMLNKKHLSCSYHRIREAVAGRMLTFHHISSENNISDIMTKPLGRMKHQTLMNRLIGRKPFEIPCLTSLMDKYDKNAHDNTSDSSSRFRGVSRVQSGEPN